MSKFFDFILCVALLFSSLGLVPTPVMPNPGKTPVQINQAYAIDHLIVKLQPEVQLDANGLTTRVSSLDHSLASLGAIGFENLKGISNTYRLKFEKGTNILKAVEMLNADPAVEYAEPDYLAKYAAAPDDPRYNEQWGLSKVQAEGAWDQTSGSTSIVIAIVDSGVDVTHVDLTPNLWINPGEVVGNGIDDDNNGFIDDYQGWNFVDATNNVQDYIGHGSLVAGVAAARTNNATGIAGVCGNCRIMPVKITQLSGFANYSDIAAGIYYAANKGARVINLSVGGYSDSVTVKTAIQYALGKNIVVVGGAGNDNLSSPFYPAAYDGVIAVAGTDANDIKVNSSNFGLWVDVSAPGKDILSTTLGDYSSDTGTSYATPFLSGAAGLILSQHPDWSPTMVRSQLMHTTDGLDVTNPTLVGMLGSGRLNLTAAVQPPQPILTYQSYVGNGIPNLRPDFGSTVDLTITLYNDWADALEVVGTLSSSDPYVTISTPQTNFGDIVSGQNKANSEPFTFEISVAAGYNHAIPFNLALSANGGTYSISVDFTITTRTSEEPVGGTIEGDITWTNDKTYKVTSNVGVAPGSILTIQPGTSVKFAGDYSLNIGGTLVALGTQEQPIHFEPYIAGGNWGRIFFDDPSLDAQVTSEGIYISGNALQHVFLSGSTNGIQCSGATPYISWISMDGGGLNCGLGSTDVWVSDSTLTGTVNIFQGGSTPEHFVRVTSNNDAIIPSSSVIDSLFKKNIAIQGNGWVRNSIVGNLAINGNGDILQVTANGTITISAGRVENTTANGGSIQSSGTGIILNSSTFGGGIYAGPSSSITNCNSRGGGIIGGDGSTITRNNIINSSSTGIVSTGSSSVTYNRVVGVAMGIEVVSGFIENNLIANISGDGLHPGTASIRNNTLIGISGKGMLLNNVPVALENNNFEFNSGTYDIYITIPKTTIINLIASNNWWGTVDSNLIKQRTWDYYDDYNLTKLITSPILTTPSQTAPAYVRGVTLDPTSPVGIQTVSFTTEFSRSMDISVNPLVSHRTSNSDSWAARAGMPTPRLALAVVAAANGKIYAIGGANENGALSIVEEYDPGTNTWIRKSDMPTARSFFEAVLASNGKIYAIGGATTNEYDLSVVEEYDPLTDTWATKSSMPTARHRIGATFARNGRIYVMGGEIFLHPGVTVTNVVEEFDPVTDSWTTRSSMPTSRNSLGVATATNGKVYAIGGHNGNFLSIVEEYDPNTDTWAIKSNMPTPRNAFGITVGGNGKIYVIGGYNNGPLSMVEEYDPLIDEWKTHSDMLTDRTLFGAVLSNNGKIYAIGGAGNSGSLTTVEVYTPPDYGMGIIDQNALWVDTTHFRANYDFSSLNPRGEYRVTVEDIIDTNGTLIVTDNRTTFNVDYAGEISDTTPPLSPSVLAWGNGSLTELSAQATTTDPESVIVGYRYAIGSTPGGADVISWSNIASPSITRTGLSLLPDQPYYVSFMARNLAGLWSPVGVSNGVVNGNATIPLPTITNINPQSVFAGSAAFTLSITGSNFVNGSIARWNGSDRTTTFVDASHLTTSIQAADISVAGDYVVTVYSPAPTNSESNGLTFTVLPINPVPVITVLNPASVIVGSGGITLTVTGSGFLETSKIHWNTQELTTNFISSTELRAHVGEGFLLTPGMVEILVISPAPGGGESNIMTFIIESRKVFIPLIMR